MYPLHLRLTVNDNVESAALEALVQRNDDLLGGDHLQISQGLEGDDLSEQLDLLITAELVDGASVQDAVQAELGESTADGISKAAVVVVVLVAALALALSLALSLILTLALALALTLALVLALAFTTCGGSSIASCGIGSSGSRRSGSDGSYGSGSGGSSGSSSSSVSSSGSGRRSSSVVRISRRSCGSSGSSSARGGSSSTLLGGISSGGIASRGAAVLLFRGTRFLANMISAARSRKIEQQEHPESPNEQREAEPEGLLPGQRQ